MLFELLRQHNGRNNGQLHLAVPWRPHIPDRQRVRFFDDDEPDSPECVSLPLLTAFLQEQKLGELDTIDFLERAGRVTACAPLFCTHDSRDASSSLADLPPMPPPKSMSEFVPGAPWGWSGGEENADDTRAFAAWREIMRPEAARLESALGKAVYHFANPDAQYDDDYMHRFLVLHWCCTYRPDSTYVRFLLGVCGASDAEEIKQAMLDPASYTQPFELNFAWYGLEAKRPCHFEYLPQHTL